MRIWSRRGDSNYDHLVLVIKTDGLILIQVGHGRVGRRVARIGGVSALIFRVIS